MQYLLYLRGIPTEIIGQLTNLYSETESAVRCMLGGGWVEGRKEGGVSSFFPVNTGVRQGCVHAFVFS